MVTVIDMFGCGDPEFDGATSEMYGTNECRIGQVSVYWVLFT